MEDFRKAAARLNDWIAKYLEESEKYPVLAQVKPGQIRQQLPAYPPQEAESFDSILHDFEKILLPGITHWNHPAFFAYFAITGSPPGILGDMLSSALNVNTMLWKTCPASTELEEVVLDWLRQMLGLPEGLFGVMMDTASVASLCAMAAARESLGFRIRKKGMAGRSELPRLRIYTSEHANSSIDKGAIVAGFGEEGLRKIPADREFRMRSDVLQQAVEEDQKHGWRPVCVVATVGTTSSTSIDPVAEIADVCERYGLWLHVDAAYGGAAAILPEMRHVLRGCDRADSFVMNPHKWLFVPFDLTAFYTRKPEIFKQTFSLAPEYLNTGAEEVHNLTDYGIQLGRRFRALKLWMVIRMFGVQGLQDVIRNHLALASEFASWVDQDPNFERMAPVPFSVICFRARPDGYAESDLNQLNEDLMNAVNQTGEMYISHTKLNGKTVLRLAIGHLRTERRHIERARELLQFHLREITTKIRKEKLR